MRKIITLMHVAYFLLSTILFAALLKVSCLNPDSENNVITSREMVDIQNLTVTEVKDEEPKKDDIIVHGGLEPSIEMLVASDEIDSKIEKLSFNSETEDSILTDRTLSNNSPIILTESSTFDLEQLPDVSLVITSQNEEIQPKNIVLQSEKIAEKVSVDNETKSDKKDSDFDDEIQTGSENLTKDQSEDIPSFSEWAQKRLEEVEKNEQINSSVKGQTVNGKTQNAKLRWKNYASIDCGAKVVGANPEAKSPGAILSPSSDEYKLNPCTSRIWFVVELCEAIQPTKIELANYELFSSSPKDFTVLISERYPTRDWTVVGKFTAKDERDIQSFNIDSQIFGKYIKIEIKSHYGSEHYCPLSLFRAYGTTVFEVLQKEDPAHEHRLDEDDEDSEDDEIKLYDDTQKNLFSSAKEAVISMVKKAAEVLGNKVNNETNADESNVTSFQLNRCITPRYSLVCTNCTETLFSQIYELLSCKMDEIRKIVSIPVVYKFLVETDSCAGFGLPKNVTTSSKRLQSFLTPRYLGALCNEAAILQNYSVLNITQQFFNMTQNLTSDKIIEMKVVDVPPGNLNKTPLESFIVTSSPNESSTETETISYATQIKPTKALTMDPNLTQTLSPEDQRLEVLTLETVTESVDDVHTVTEADGEGSSESIDTLDEQLDHITDSTTATSASSASNTPQGSKESIFLRLSNRIKALERNMSLSSQYLEELSKRYKKQVEDIQHLLEKTIVTLREENIKRNKQLEDRLDNLTATIESLSSERRFLRSAFYSFICIAVLGIGCYFFCGKLTAHSDASAEKTPKILRRRSMDDLTLKEKKKRRPSDQVMKIVRRATTTEEKLRKPKKRRKKPIIQRTQSTNSLKTDKNLNTPADWVESSHETIGDIPFVLDESDNLTLEVGSLPNVYVNKEDVKREPSPERARSETKDIEDVTLVMSYKRSISDSPSRMATCEDRVKKQKKGLKKFLKKVF